MAGRLWRDGESRFFCEIVFKNVGSVRFELTIDGSLRHASVLQRVITDSADPLLIIHTGRERPLEPVAIPD